MSSDNNNNNLNGKDFLLGAIMGGLLGAAVALVLAPKSGSELRGDITEQYQQVVDKTQQLASNATEKGQEIVKTISNQTSDWAVKAKEVAETVAEEVKGWRDSNKEVAGSAEVDETEAATSTDEDVSK